MKFVVDTLKKAEKLIKYANTSSLVNCRCVLYTETETSETYQFQKHSKTSPILSNSFKSILDESQLNHLHKYTSK